MQFAEVSRLAQPDGRSSFNLDEYPLPFDISNGITFAQATQILDDDIARVTAKLFADLPWLQNLDIVRQGVFLNMSFNMGVGGILEFHHDLADTETQELHSSRGGHESLGYTSRFAASICQQMITGIWQ